MESWMLKTMEAWQDLMARGRSGDREAIEILVRRYQYETHVKSWIRAYLGNPARLKLEVEDLVQETFLRAWCSIQQFQGETENEFQGWLRTISRRVVLDQIRQRNRDRDPQDHEVPLGPENDAAGTGRSPTQGPVRDERFKKLKRAVRSLSPDHRSVITLVFFQGKSIKETAERFSRTPGATSELLKRALKKLKAAYGRTDGSMELPRDRSLDGGLTEDEGEIRDG